MEIKNRIFVAFCGEGKNGMRFGNRVITTDEEYPLCLRSVKEIKETLCEWVNLSSVVILNIIPLRFEETEKDYIMQLETEELP